MKGAVDCLLKRGLFACNMSTGEDGYLVSIKTFPYFVKLIS